MTRQLTPNVQINDKVSATSSISEDLPIVSHNVVTSVVNEVSDSLIFADDDGTFNLVSGLRRVRINPTMCMIAKDVHGMQTVPFAPGLTMQFFKDRLTNWEVSEVRSAMQALNEQVTSSASANNSIFGVQAGRRLRPMSYTVDRVTNLVTDRFARQSEVERSIIRDVIASLFEETSLLQKSKRSTYVTAQARALHPSLGDAVQDIQDTIFLTNIDDLLRSMKHGNGTSGSNLSSAMSKEGIDANTLQSWLAEFTAGVYRIAVTSEIAVHHLDTFLAVTQTAVTADITTSIAEQMVPRDILNSPLIMKATQNATILGWLKDRAEGLEAFNDARAIRTRKNPLELSLTTPELAEVFYDVSWGKVEQTIMNWMEMSVRYQMVPISQMLDSLDITPSVHSGTNSVLGGVIRSAVTMENTSIMDGPGVLTITSRGSGLAVIEPVIHGTAISKRVLKSYHMSASDRIIDLCASSLADVNAAYGAAAQIYVSAPSKQFIDFAAMAAADEVFMLFQFDELNDKVELFRPSEVAFEYMISDKSGPYNGFFADWSTVYCTEAIVPEPEESEEDFLERAQDLFEEDTRPEAVAELRRMRQLATLSFEDGKMQVTSSTLLLLLLGDRSARSMFDLANMPDVAPFLTSAYVTSPDVWLNSLDHKVELSYNGQLGTRDGERGLNFSANLNDLLLGLETNDPQTGSGGFVMARPNEQFTQRQFIFLLQQLSTLEKASRVDGVEDAEQVVPASVLADLRHQVVAIWSAYGNEIVAEHGNDAFIMASKVRRAISNQFAPQFINYRESERAEIHLGAVVTQLILSARIFGGVTNGEVASLVESAALALATGQRIVADAFSSAN